MQSTTSCEHCGATLRARTLEMFGRQVFTGFEECHCEGAEAKRKAQRLAEEHRAREKRESRLRAAIRKAGVMPRYENATHPMAAELAGEVLRSRNVYIHGDVGTLKTHLASATAIELVRRGQKVVFSAMWKVLDEIKVGFRDGSNPLPRYQQAQALVIDDFGKEAPTSFALERMFALMDERNARMLPTVVTTQYKPSKLIERLTLNGDADTAKAIVSRLRQDCRTVELSGKDRRRG